MSGRRGTPVRIRPVVDDYDPDPPEEVRFRLREHGGVVCLEFHLPGSDRWETGLVIERAPADHPQPGLLRVLRVGLTPRDREYLAYGGPHRVTDGLRFWRVDDPR